MKHDHEPTTADKTKFGMMGAVFAALGASACCVLPLVLVTIGVSGAWIGNLTALEKYRPIFMAVTFGFLGFAFYKAYKPGAEACSVDGPCADDKARRTSKFILWILTALISVLLAFPYAAPYIFAGTVDTSPVAEKAVVLHIEGMTCNGCIITVKKSLTRVDGVVEAKVTLDPPQAVVKYDSAKVTVAALITATTNAGYPSKLFNDESVYHGKE